MLEPAKNVFDLTHGKPVGWRLSNPPWNENWRAVSATSLRIASKRWRARPGVHDHNKGVHDDNFSAHDQ